MCHSYLEQKICDVSLLLSICSCQGTGLSQLSTSICFIQNNDELSKTSVVKKAEDNLHCICPDILTFQQTWLTNTISNTQLVL